MGFVEAIVDIGSGVGELVVTAFETMSQIFFNVSDAGAITVQPLGYLALIGLTLSIIWRVFNYVKSLVKARG